MSVFCVCVYVSRKKWSDHDAENKCRTCVRLTFFLNFFSHQRLKEIANLHIVRVSQANLLMLMLQQFFSLLMYGPVNRRFPSFNAPIANFQQYKNQVFFCFFFKKKPITFLPLIRSAIRMRKYCNVAV